MSTSSDEPHTDSYQRPDSTPKNTGTVLHESIAYVTVDDDKARSNYTIHVEHPDHDGGVRCFWRNSRDMVVSGLRKHLENVTDTDIARVEVTDRTGLGLTEAELRPESFNRTGPFAPDTPEIEVEP